jgi:hypothetical protein
VGSPISLIQPCFNQNPANPLRFAASMNKSLGNLAKEDHCSLNESRQ